MINLHKYKFFLFCLSTYFFSRLISNYYFGINIEEKWISSLWQHIPHKYLKENFISSLLYFHAQPPIWNLILGLGTKITDIINLELYIKYLNNFFSLIIIYCSYQILKNLNFNKKRIYFFILFFVILSPSILFYENFPSYAHFSCMIIFIIKLNFLKILKKYKFKYELSIYLFSTILILTWSAYIIYFNLLIFLLLLPTILKKGKVFKSLMIFVLFFIIGSTPSIKNKILFDIYANSSWSGLNASQATGYDRQNWPLCSFNNDNINEYNNYFKKNLGNKTFFDNKILNDGSFNDLGYIYKSKICSKKSRKFLFLNFINITKTKLKRFVSVHAHLSIDFAFKPKNWSKNFSLIENLNNHTFFKISVFIFFLLNYCIYLFLLKNSFLKKEKNHIDHFIIINFLLYLYLLLVSFYGSTWEQERMRYTEYSFILISTVLILNKINLLRKFRF